MKIHVLFTKTKHYRFTYFLTSREPFSLFSMSTVSMGRLEFSFTSATDQQGGKKAVFNYWYHKKRKQHNRNKHYTGTQACFHPRIKVLSKTAFLRNLAKLVISNKRGKVDLCFQTQAIFHAWKSRKVSWSFLKIINFWSNYIFIRIQSDQRYIGRYQESCLCLQSSCYTDDPDRPMISSLVRSWNL